MTREEASFYLANMDRKYMEKGMSEALDMAIQALSQEPTEKPMCDRNICISNEYNGIGCDECIVNKVEQEPCETCGYAEGSPFCLQYCPYDAERKKEQEPTVQDKQAESEKYQKAYDDGYDDGYAQARFDYEQEPCDDAISRESEDKG